MAKKTWKIGEYAMGGIIQSEVLGNKLTVIGKEWDISQGTRRGSNQSNAKEFTRLTVNLDDYNAYRSLDNFLNYLTTSYYSGLVMDWFKSKSGIKFT